MSAPLHHPDCTWTTSSGRRRVCYVSFDCIPSVSEELCSRNTCDVNKCWMEVKGMHDVPSPTTRNSFLFCLWEMAALLVEAEGVSCAGFMLS